MYSVCYIGGLDIAPVGVVMTAEPIRIVGISPGMVYQQARLPT